MAGYASAVSGPEDADLQTIIMDFPIHGEYIELCKLIKAANLVMSGGEAKEVVAGGWVTVDGQIETRKRCKIHRGQVIEFDGRTITVIQAG